MIEFSLIQNVTRTEALEALEASDIVIDQLLIGEYGVLSIEAMALNKKVLCYIRPKVLKLYQCLFGSIPVINCDFNSLERTLRKIASQDFNNKETSSRAYVEKYHESQKVSALLIKIYLGQVPPLTSSKIDGDFVQHF